jgi:hypothetical protein
MCFLCESDFADHFVCDHFSGILGIILLQTVKRNINLFFISWEIRMKIIRMECRDVCEKDFYS